MSLQALNPITLPLQGLQVIEASAGTGKTYTLAALYVRLVLGHGRVQGALTPPEILVMTFTEAATAELRDRIRSRLTQAAQDFRQTQEPADAYLRDLKNCIDAHDWPGCAARLDAAAQWMDEAAIFTIHGWSSRMLRQHAFDSSSLFEQSTVEDSEALRLQAAADYWRQWYYAFDEAQLSALLPIAKTPQALVKKLQPFWRAQERTPPADLDAVPADLAVSPQPETPAHIMQQWSATQQQVAACEAQACALWATHADTLLAQLGKAMDHHLNGNSFRVAHRAAYLQQLKAWTQGATLDKKLVAKFGLRSLTAKTHVNSPKPQDPTGALSAMQAWSDALDSAVSPESGLLAHAAQAITQSYDRSKQQRGQFDFADLLTRLHAALHVQGSRLPEVIRKQYPVALVDEFQDTDPWQWGALSKIYPDPQASDVALLLIGDPKQAIYSFRGADLPTYLAARERAQAVHTLLHNYRSTPEVIAAVNHVFSQAVQPFGVLEFLPAHPPQFKAASDAQAAELVNAPAMTVWHLHSGTEMSRPLSAQHYLQRMSAVCASQMVALLQSGAAQPAQLAVLVRDGREARAIRQALQTRGVRSVYLSDRDSVFATREALDLWHILQAIAQPQSVQHLRSALSCRTLGLAAAEIEHLLQDEAAWDAQVDCFGRWQQTWQRQGFLPMLYQWLHEQQIAQRLTANTPDPERRLTNLLHLGDLLQKASLNLQGQGAVLRYLADQLHSPQAIGEAAQMRLETDADLVQVITMHKAKGLQFPWVYVPFASNFKKEKKDSLRSDTERLAEDKRLLYVALTRAEQALFLGVAHRSKDFTGKSKKPASALSDLLGRTGAGDLQDKLELWSACPAIQVVSAPEPSDALYQPTQLNAAPKAALTPLRQHHNPWWMASFSALTRKHAQTVSWALPSEADERWQDAQTDSDVRPDLTALDAAMSAPQLPFNGFKAGSAYGTLLHDLLEWQHREGWPVSREAAQQAELETASETHQRWQQLFSSQTAALQLDAAQCDLLLLWLQHIAQTPLPFGQALEAPQIPSLRLSDLTPASAWAEMNFTLRTHGIQAQALDAIICAHVLPSQPREPLQARSLQGLLTGFMDLVFEHAGRYYVLDYKSNKLPGYTPADLAQGLLAHRYDVQFSLYLLALHRLLKARLPGYAYETHMGGAVYLFARGIDQPGAGVFAHRPAQEMIEVMDAAFKGTL
jgi:exodeoxyribonuclease V beta subunit